MEERFELLNSRRYNFQTPVEKKIVLNINEKLFYVASNCDEAINKSIVKTQNITKYKLSNGDEILISVELFKCAFKCTEKYVTCI